MKKVLKTPGELASARQLLSARKHLRPDYRITYHFAAYFSDVAERAMLSRGQTARGSRRWIFLRYRGQTISEASLCRELSSRPSPSGRRTMWDQFKDCRYELVGLGALRLEIADDPILEMSERLLFAEEDHAAQR